MARENDVAADHPDVIAEIESFMKDARTDSRTIGQLVSRGHMGDLKNTEGRSVVTHKIRAVLAISTALFSLQYDIDAFKEVIVAVL